MDFKTNQCPNFHEPQLNTKGKRKIMAKVAPYHTNSDEYGAHHREVYHDKDTCPDGKRIKPEHKVQGSAGRPLCKECPKVD
jgi:hypothetical protein